MKTSLDALLVLSASMCNLPAIVLLVAENDTRVGTRSANLLLNGSFEADGGLATNNSYWATGNALSPTLSLNSWTASRQVGSYATWRNERLGGNKGSTTLPYRKKGLYCGAGIMNVVATWPPKATNGKVTFSSTPALLSKPTDGPVTLEQTAPGLNTSATYLLDFWTSSEDIRSFQFPVDSFFSLEITGESRLYLAPPSGLSDKLVMDYVMTELGESAAAQGARAAESIRADILLAQQGLKSRPRCSSSIM